MSPLTQLTPIRISITLLATFMLSVMTLWVFSNAERANAQTTSVTVFINEFHYSNFGANTGVGVEIAGPADTDLSTYTIVTYDGDDGTKYGTDVALSGTIDDEGSSGYGAVWFAMAASRLQWGPDGIALVNTPSGGTETVIQFLCYEGSFAATDGPASGTTCDDIGESESSTTPAGHSLQLTECGTVYSDFTWAPPKEHTRGDINTGQIFAEQADCPAPPEPTPKKIHEIQGSGPSVIYTELVEIEGIVIAIIEKDDATDAFFVQEQDSETDGDPATSEGILVFCRGACSQPEEGSTPEVEVAIGDIVTVTGTPEEASENSQIDARTGSITVDSSGNSLPVAAVVTLPAATSIQDAATFEHLEGMIVTIPTKLVVSEYFELAQYGRIVLTARERPYQFTHDNRPSVDGYAAHLADLATRQIVLDDNTNNLRDAIRGGPDEPYPYPSSAYPTDGLSTTNYFRGGDAIRGLTGVMHYYFSDWRIRPIEGMSYEFTPENPRPASPSGVRGSLTVASINVLDFFSTLDTGNAICGPGGNKDCDGADSEVERTRQLDKIVAAIDTMDAAVVGLIEIENNATESLEMLVAGLNAVAGTGTYEYINTGIIGTDAIKVGIAYQPALVTPKGNHAILDSSVDANFIDTKNRPVLIQSFTEDASGEVFTVAVNHLKDKGSHCNNLNDPDLNDGQANCNLTRTKAAQALADYLATDPTNSEDPDFLIMGDLNAYAMEDPITTLQDNGYVNLAASRLGANAYGYVFDSQLGYLDYAMASQSLAPQVGSITEWHINADEIPLFDYNDDITDPGESSSERKSNATTMYAADPYRSSDHDPVVIGLHLGMTVDYVQSVGGSRDTCPRALAVTGIDSVPLDIAGIPAGSSLHTDLACLIEQKVLTEEQLLSDGSYDPSAPINRGDLADLVAGLYAAVAQAQAPIADVPFTDIAELSTGTQQNIARVVGLGIMQGTTETTFDAAAVISRSEAAVIVVHAYTAMVGRPPIPSHSPFTDTGHLERDVRYAIDDLFGIGVTRGTTDATYSPDALLKHREAVAFAARMYRLLTNTSALEMPETQSDSGSG